MIALQNIPEELKAFIKQQELSWSKKAVGECQTAVQTSLPDAVMHALVVQAGREMSISDNFESTLGCVTTVPKQGIVVFRQGIGDLCYGAAYAKKAGVRATPIGRLIMLYY